VLLGFARRLWQQRHTLPLLRSEVLLLLLLLLLLLADVGKRDLLVARVRARSLA
jgi:hypothetical protein